MASPQGRNRGHHHLRRWYPCVLRLPPRQEQSHSSDPRGGWIARPNMQVIHHRIAVGRRAFQTIVPAFSGPVAPPAWWSPDRLSNLPTDQASHGHDLRHVPPRDVSLGALRGQGQEVLHHRMVAPLLPNHLFGHAFAIPAIFNLARPSKCFY